MALLVLPTFEVIMCECGFYKSVCTRRNDGGASPLLLQQLTLDHQQWYRHHLIHGRVDNWSWPLRRSVMHTHDALSDSSRQRCLVLCMQCRGHALFALNRTVRTDCRQPTRPDKAPETPPGFSLCAVIHAHKRLEANTFNKNARYRKWIARPLVQSI